jgi:hypothetical protein
MVPEKLPPRAVQVVQLTNESVKADEVESVKLPKGARVASPEESAAYYRSNSNFRDDLCRNGAAWTNKIGWEIKGLNEIDARGSFKGIDEDRFYGELAKTLKIDHFIMAETAVWPSAATSGPGDCASLQSGSGIVLGWRT